MRAPTTIVVKCKLCNIDRTRVLFETDTCVVVEGFPHHRGHIVVALKKHATRLTELGPGEYLRFCRDLMVVAQAVEEVLKPDKLNYALLGN